MLDLKQLEEKLDEVLRSETPASLHNWLIQKRNANLFLHLNQSPFDKQESYASSFVEAYTETPNYYSVPTNNQLDNDEKMGHFYSLAA